MTRIGLISDTHGFLDEAVFRHFEECNEIWHAGDFGSMDVFTRLQEFRPLKAVWGNIDGQDIRSSCPEKISWTCEGVNVYMVHIGGHPAKYAPGVKKELVENAAKLFICGHSHILKIIYDDKIDCLHMNPGAAGRQGWHKTRTIVRFTIEGKDIRDCEVIELGLRSYA